MHLTFQERGGGNGETEETPGRPGLNRKGREGGILNRKGGAKTKREKAKQKQKTL